MTSATKRIYLNSVVLFLCVVIATYGSSLGTVVVSTWGNIAGTLSNQSDLNTALSGKLATANNLSEVTAATARTNLGLGAGDSPTLTALTLSAVPSAHVFNSAVQSIPDTTATLVTFDSETWDTGATHSTVTNTDRITVPTGGGGTWFVSGQVTIAASSLGRRAAQIRKNDTAICTGKQLLGDATFTSVVSASCIVQLAATDYLNMTAQQVSGGALNTVAGTNNTFLQATKLY